MSIYFTPRGSLNSFGQTIAATTPVVVYTALNTARPVLESINVANRTGSAVTFDIAWYKAATLTTTYLIYGISAPAAGRTYIDNIPISMRDGDQIIVTAATADALDVIVNLIEGLGASQ